MQRVLTAINFLRQYNHEARDDRFTAVIDILESIVRDEIRLIEPRLTKDMSQIQKDMLRATMNNLGVDAIQFEDNPPITRRDLDEPEEDNS